MDFRTFDIERIEAYQEQHSKLVGKFYRDAIRTIPLYVADEFEAYVQEKAKGRLANATRASLVKQRLPQLRSSLMVGQPPDWLPGGATKAHRTFGEILVLEDVLRAECTAPIRWWLQPSESKTHGEGLEGLKPFHNYFWYVSACWLDWLPSDIFIEEGELGIEERGALLQAEDYVTRHVILNALRRE